jgi:hypothetical protein
MAKSALVDQEQLRLLRARHGRRDQRSEHQKSFTLPLVRETMDFLCQPSLD